MIENVYLHEEETSLKEMAMRAPVFTFKSAIFTLREFVPLQQFTPVIILFLFAFFFWRDLRCNAAFQVLLRSGCLWVCYSDATCVQGILDLIKSKVFLSSSSASHDDVPKML